MKIFDWLSSFNKQCMLGQCIWNPKPKLDAVFGLAVAAYCCCLPEVTKQCTVKTVPAWITRIARNIHISTVSYIAQFHLHVSRQVKGSWWMNCTFHLLSQYRYKQLLSHAGSMYERAHFRECMCQSQRDCFGCWTANGLIRAGMGRYSRTIQIHSCIVK